MKKKTTIPERLKMLKDLDYQFDHYSINGMNELEYEFVKKSKTDLFHDIVIIVVNIYAHKAMGIMLRQARFID